MFSNASASRAAPAKFGEINIMMTAPTIFIWGLTGRRVHVDEPDPHHDHAAAEGRARVDLIY